MGEHRARACPDWRVDVEDEGAAPRPWLEAEYARVWAAILACADRGAHEEEARLRNRAQALLLELQRLGRRPLA